MRRRDMSGRSTTEAQMFESPVLCWTMKGSQSSAIWTGLLLLSAALVSACGNSLEERAGSGAAIGAGAGVAVGVIASPSVVGGVLVGAAAGGISGLALHEVKTNGASEPRGVVLRQHMREQARLWNVTYPILTEGAEVCRDRARPNFGFVAWTRWDIDRHYRIASMGVYGLDDRLRVVHILPGSPAADAGLLAGDEIELVGRHDMPTGKTASTALELVLQRESVVGAAQIFRIRRGDARHTFSIAPRAQCDVDLIVTNSDQVNAFSHGRSVYVTDGLMRFLSDDRELAALSAHFVAHGLLEHKAGSDDETMTGKLQTQMDGLRLVFLGEDDKDEMKRAGISPEARPYRVEQEIQADRAALELLARADYDLEALVDVWQRLADAQPGTVLLGDFHPPSEERRAAVQDILTQVRSENGAGKLEPDS